MDWIVKRDEPILVTGAAGYIGSRVVKNLLNRGFTRVRCFVRPSSNVGRLDALKTAHPEAAAGLSLVRGNLLSSEDCQAAARDVSVIYHLAAGTGTKSFPDAFMNSVVTTRNLMEATLKTQRIKRFVNVSSFAVYTNQDKPNGRVLDETCPIEQHATERFDAYCFAKVKQDELVMDYQRQHGIPYVLMRPGVVYGPGRGGVPGRVGLGTFGVFLHFGGSNTVPLTYVDNCADAIVLAGLVAGVDNEVFNITDDDLPTSRQLLRAYKREVRPFKSVFVPRLFSYLFYAAWERYARWSQNQLPPVYNRRTWHAYWKKTRYTNAKLKERLGWSPAVPTAEALDRYFESCRERGAHA